MTIKELKDIIEEYPDDYIVRVGRCHIHKDTIYEDVLTKTVYLN